jgi:ferric-chelate reductase (NADPH)
VSSVTKLVADAAARLLFTPASVGTVTEHDQFRTIELVGERLVGTDWVPGDKLRLHLEGTVLRTYTPFAWDRDAGSTRLLAYLPGDGPGSGWCAHARPGDPCGLLGPKRSVRLDQLDPAPVIVGDETSFGLLLAWHRHQPRVSPAASVFEVTSATAAGAVLDELGAGATALVERVPGDAHFEPLAERVAAAVRDHPDAPLCLTGCAQTIAAIRRHLKDQGLARKGGVVKAYWDRNRKGLD